MRFLIGKWTVHVKNDGLRPIFFRGKPLDCILGYRSFNPNLMNLTLPALNRYEWPFHVLFWLVLVGSAMINADWMQLFPDRGFSFVLVTAVIPIYVNALLLIPRYFNRRHWLTYGVLLILLLLAASAAKALFFMASFAWTGETFDAGQ